MQSEDVSFPIAFVSNAMLVYKEVLPPHTFLAICIVLQDYLAHIPLVMEGKK
jgi:hypothetical protein